MPGKRPRLGDAGVRPRGDVRGLKRRPLDYVAPGMFVARPIVDEAGRVLLNAGVPLTDRYLATLAEKGFHYLYVRELAPPPNDGFVPQTVPEEHVVGGRSRGARVLGGAPRTGRRGTAHALGTREVVQSTRSGRTRRSRRTDQSGRRRRGGFASRDGSRARSWTVGATRAGAIDGRTRRARRGALLHLRRVSRPRHAPDARADRRRVVARHRQSVRGRRRQTKRIDRVSHDAGIRIVARVHSRQPVRATRRLRTPRVSRRIGIAARVGGRQPGRTQPESAAAESLPWSAKSPRLRTITTGSSKEFSRNRCRRTWR
jgi:hypothetical protein